MSAAGDRGRAGRRGRRLARLEGRLWTGSLAHLAGGALDLAGALARHRLARLRRRLAERLREAFRL